jgi:hypothetical protein
MRSFALVALLGTALISLGAGECSRQRSIEITSPEATEDGCGVQVEFALVGSYQVPTLTATLNGQALALSGTGPLFSVAVAPSPLLVIDGPNTLEVSANRTSDGVLDTVSRVFTYSPPAAEAREIVDRAVAIQGPLGQ